MESLFKIMYFLAANDPGYNEGTIRDNLLGINDATGDVFENTLLLSLLAALVIAILYYLILNRFFTLNKIWIWGIFLAISTCLGWLIAYYFVGTYIYEVPAPIEALGWKFISLSAIYAALYFYIFSLLFKPWSVFAKFIPH
jgi:hypothetical protein